MAVDKQAALPSGRFNRSLRLGRLATGMAATAFNHGARQLVRGEIPTASGALLNSANARRIAAQLSEMRGAVMKVGQLMSMEAGDLLPRELTELLAGLRDNAHGMTDAQLESVLAATWGRRWRNRFRSFARHPFAAASIGQVHEAVDASGRRLAVKVQYPGVAASIDGDLDNVACLLKLFRLLPPAFDIQSMLDLARAQLHDEADYLLEARNLTMYREKLGQDRVFRVPEVIDELSGPVVLAMTYVEGESIERLVAVEPGLRDRLAARMIDLTLWEFLHWGVVQSDPNFANFLYNAADDTIGLLDFGALQINDSSRARSFAALLSAAIDRDLRGIIDAAVEVGYIAHSDPFNFRMAIADLIRTAAEPAQQAGGYDFGNSSLSRRLADKLLYLRNQQGFERIPPADVIFLHRKLAGIYLLCARINARVDVRACIMDALKARSLPSREQLAAG